MARLPRAPLQNRELTFGRTVQPPDSGDGGSTMHGRAAKEGSLANVLSPPPPPKIDLSSTPNHHHPMFALPSSKRTAKTTQNRHISRRARFTMGMGTSSGGSLSPTRASPRSPITTLDGDTAAPTGILPDTGAAQLNGSSGGGDLLDLEDIFGGGAAPSTSPPPAVVNGGTLGGSGIDLLADVFGGGGAGGLVPTSGGLGSSIGGGSGGIMPVAGGVVVPIAVTTAVPAVVPSLAVVEDDDFGGFEVAPSRDEEMVVSLETWRSAFCLYSC